ncbi:MAG: protein TolR [Pseudomonadales bacterium]|nr:protein TolR [Pseudomonadales bacterium]
MSEINVVPYIDVMLVLLVIFMVTAPILTQGVEVNLPQKPSDPMSNDQDDPFIVSVRRDGAIFINVGMRNMDEEANRVTIFSLEDQASRVIAARPDVPVYIRADSDLTYAEVIEIMTVLQRSGAESVGLITDPPQV